MATPSCNYQDYRNSQRRSRSQGRQQQRTKRTRLGNSGINMTSSYSDEDSSDSEDRTSRRKVTTRNKRSNSTYSGSNVFQTFPNPTISEFVNFSQLNRNFSNVANPFKTILSYTEDNGFGFPESKSNISQPISTAPGLKSDFTFPEWNRNMNKASTASPFTTLPNHTANKAFSFPDSKTNIFQPFSTTPVFKSDLPFSGLNISVNNTSTASSFTTLRSYTANKAVRFRDSETSISQPFSTKRGFKSDLTFPKCNRNMNNASPACIFTSLPNYTANKAFSFPDANTIIFQPFPGPPDLQCNVSVPELNRNFNNASTASSFTTLLNSTTNKADSFPDSKHSILQPYRTAPDFKSDLTFPEWNRNINNVSTASSFTTSPNYTANKAFSFPDANTSIFQPFPGPPDLQCNVSVPELNRNVNNASTASSFTTLLNSTTNSSFAESKTSIFQPFSTPRGLQSDLYAPELNRNFNDMSTASSFTTLSNSTTNKAFGFSDSKTIIFQPFSTPCGLQSDLHAPELNRNVNDTLTPSSFTTLSNSTTNKTFSFAEPKTSIFQSFSTAPGFKSDLTFPERNISMKNTSTANRFTTLPNCTINKAFSFPDSKTSISQPLSTASGFKSNLTFPELNRNVNDVSVANSFTTLSNCASGKCFSFPDAKRNIFQSFSTESSIKSDLTFPNLNRNCSNGSMVSPFTIMTSRVEPKAVGFSDSKTSIFQPLSTASNFKTEGNFPNSNSNFGDASKAVTSPFTSIRAATEFKGNVSFPDYRNGRITNSENAPGTTTGRTQVRKVASSKTSEIPTATSVKTNANRPVLRFTEGPKAEGRGPNDESSRERNKENESNSIRCPVCLMTEKELESSGCPMMGFKCGHLVCNACLPNLIALTKKCPKCQQGFTASDIRRIYL